jgi:glycosyltransferase involved in cell wall biosynthesis
MISVIIIAYNRKKYILDAIKSSLNQTLSNDKYEIIVIKNFKDDLIDKFIKENNIINIYSDEKTLSGKIVNAVKIAKGDVISFLEDDDEFNNEKLRKVYEVFKKYNSIPLYYYNNRSLINEYGKTIKSLKFLRYKGVPVSDLKFIPSKTAGLMKNLPSFNNSSISISRTILNEHLSELSLLSTPLTDLFMLAAALASQASVIIDNALLTKYRLHGNQTRQIKELLISKDIAKLETLEHQTVNDLNLIRDMCNGTYYSNEINFFIIRFHLVHHLYFYRSRMQMLKKLRDFLKMNKRLFNMDTFYLVIMSMFYLISPNILKIILLKFRNSF